MNDNPQQRLLGFILTEELQSKRKKKEKKYLSLRLQKKIKIYNKGRKNEKKSHYYIFCIHYQEVLDFMQIILNYFIEILEKYLKAGRVFLFHI